MTKEKFVRKPPRLNIGEIGSKNISPSDYERAIRTFEYFEEERSKREQAKLAKLIEQYGLEKGYDIYQKIKSQNQELEAKMFLECTPETNISNSPKKSR